MEDARVWMMTFAVVGAGGLLCLLCGGFLVYVVYARAPPSVATATAATVAAAAAETAAPDSAVILQDAARRPEAETSAVPLQVLRAGTVVTVLQRSEQRRVCRDPDCLDLRHQPLEFHPEGEGEGEFWYQVRTADGADGWVFGRDVAIRAGSSHVATVPDLGWGDRGTLLADLDQDGTLEQIWFAVTDVCHAFPSWLDPTPGGYLVVEDPDTGHAATFHVAGILISNYGDRLGELSVLDVNGDGPPELVLRIDMTLSEVGYSGHDVLILRYRDGAMEKLFREHATISQVHELGRMRWASIDVGAGEIVQDAVEFEAFSRCRAWTLDDPDTALDRCLRGEHRVWRWDTALDQFVLVSDEDALRVRAWVDPGELPWRAEPDAAAPTAGTFAGNSEVRVQQLHGWQTYTEIDGQPALWVRVVADGTAGWVPSTRLRFADEMLQPYMNGDDFTVDRVVPIAW